MHAELLSLKTLVCKLLGVSLSMAGGLMAGKQGPFIHMGAGLPLQAPMRPYQETAATLKEPMHLHRCHNIMQHVLKNGGRKLSHVLQDTWRQDHRA